MTQPADNINVITTMSMTVIQTNDVVNDAADMQTQRTVTDDKVQANASQHNTIVINYNINDENSKNSPTLDVSKQLCRIQSGHVTSLHITDFMKRHVGILYMTELTISSNQEPVIMSTNAQHNFRRGLLTTMKKGK
jgi:hypothetical protein